MQDIF